jgi:periplasmic divalent cation tolerance protein
MEIKKEIGVGVTTCSSKEVASNIVNELLSAKLIACGQVEGPVESIYRWKGRLEKETEWKITLKFDLGKRAELEGKLVKIHPYETPQWVMWKAEASEEYYNWVTGKEPN